MTQVNDQEKLTHVGDFMLAAKDGKPVIKIVTAYQYTGAELVNSRLSDRLLDRTSRWKPFIEEHSPETVSPVLQQHIESNQRLTAFRLGSGVSLNTIGRAWSSLKALKTAREEIATLHLV